MEMDERQLLTLLVEELAEVKASSKLTHDQVDRLAGINANLLLLLKRSDKQSADARLEAQAALTDIKKELGWLKSTLTSPEALAAINSQQVLDKARQVKRSNTIALTGRDPAAMRRRDDEITLVSIPLLHGGRRPYRVNKRLVKLIFGALGIAIGIIAKRHGLPWFW